MSTVSTVNAYAKAITAAIVAGLATLQIAAGDGTISGVEWIGVASAVFASFGLVWAVPNAPVEAPPISE